MLKTNKLSNMAGSAIVTIEEIVQNTTDGVLALEADKFTFNDRPVGAGMFLMTDSADDVTDWNDLIAPGVYNRIVNGSNSNGPEASSLFYYVQNYVFDVNLTQVAIPYSNTLPIRYRMLYYGVWTAWNTLATTALGEIKQWGGKVVNIPNGWSLADGSKGTVDMTADFKTYGTDTVVYIQYIGA